jgi:hypothetical protein
LISEKVSVRNTALGTSNRRERRRKGTRRVEEDR